jgi:hypothetical protein
MTASCRSLPAAAGLLAVTLFWNGIVSIFVLYAIAGTLHQVLGSVPAWFPVPPLSGSGGQGGSQGGVTGGLGLGVLLFLWAFLMPFIAVGSLMIVAVLSLVMGRLVIQIDGQIGSIQTAIGPFGWRRHFNPAVVRSVAIGQTKWLYNNEHKPLIVLEADHTVRFGSMLPEERMAWLTAVLRRLLVVR